MLSVGARDTLRVIRSLSKRRGHTFIFQRNLLGKLNVKCTLRTLQRYLRELAEAGAIERKQNQHCPASYAPVENYVQNVVADVVADVVAGDPVLRSEFNPSKAEQRPARRPPGKEASLYREAFEEEYARLRDGWTEPAGRRVYGQIKHPLNAEIVPALADAALSVGLPPSSAILSLDRELQRATARLKRANNPNGLVLYIARDTWRKQA